MTQIMQLDLFEDDFDEPTLENLYELEEEVEADIRRVENELHDLLLTLEGIQEQIKQRLLGEDEEDDAS